LLPLHFKSVITVRPLCFDKTRDFEFSSFGTDIQGVSLMILQGSMKGELRLTNGVIVELLSNFF
jgi:hypothetical protein